MISDGLEQCMDLHGWEYYDNQGKLTGYSWSN